MIIPSIAKSLYCLSRVALKHSMIKDALNFFHLVHFDRPLGVAVAIVVVDVALKPEILDPQGRAIVGALGRVGLSGVADVRQGKQFVLNIDGDVDDAKLAQINEIAATLLSNPVIEDFTVQVRP